MPRTSSSDRSVAPWWGADAPPWERWPGVSLRIDAVRRGNRWETEDGLYWFDERAATAPTRFMRTYLRHTIGEWSGQPLDLLPWQEQLIVRPLFGWKRVSDGKRRFRRAFVFVPKKNGKSTLASGLGLYLMAADGEPAARVFAAAGDEEQARIVGDEARRMAEGSPEFLRRAGVEVLANSIARPKTHSFFRALSSKASTKHGENLHGLIFDEIHAQKSRELYETLKRGVSARSQPVVLVITTAGSDRESICHEEYEYAKKVRDGVFEDTEVLPVIFEPSQDDDWASPSTWAKVNPSLGVTKKLDYMEAECRAAQNEPRKRNDFLRLELNVWTESRTVWIAPEAWAACRREEREPSDLGDLLCCLGLDLSETTDLTALVAAFRRPDARPAERIVVDGAAAEPARRSVSVDFSVDIRAWFFLPRQALLERSKRDGVPYDVWAREGWLRVTEGSIIDYRAIREVVLTEIVPRYKVHEAGFDPYNARQLCTVLQEDGVPMVEVRQGFLSLSAPSKLLEGLVAARRITHDGSPVLRWCFANAEVLSDAAGNIKPVKPGGDARGTRRIDGVTATVTALSRLMVAPEPKRSAYEQRGVQVITW